MSGFVGFATSGSPDTQPRPHSRACTHHLIAVATPHHLSYSNQSAPILFLNFPTPTLPTYNCTTTVHVTVLKIVEHPNQEGGHMQLCEGL